MTFPLEQAGIDHFDAASARMRQRLDALIAAPGHRVADHPAVPNRPGIYLFSEATTPIYVGQSRTLRSGLRHHTVARSRQNQASFAFDVAKRDASLAGVDVARYREVLQADETFTLHLDAAKARVAAMEVRVIELADPIERTMFEMYAALALGTSEFNTFETH